MTKIYNRFRQFGGLRLILEYARMGVLPLIFKSLLKGESPKAAYSQVVKAVDPFLVARYLVPKSACESDGLATSAEATSAPRERIKHIWFCWLQGMDAAPELVKACLRSLERWLPDYEITIITAENYREYVQLPDYVERKYRKGHVPHANFSDLIRLDLLVRHGGVWIDSTVLCTGWRSGSPLHTKVKTFLESELFLFRYAQTSISNWFIVSWPGNELLARLRDSLYAYWKDKDCTLNYYIFHSFFAHLAQDYPELLERMPKGRARFCLQLRDKLGDSFDPLWWSQLTEQVPFHKLNYRTADGIAPGGKTYFDHICRMQ